MSEQAGDSQAKRDWIERVLAIKFPASESGAAELSAVASAAPVVPGPEQKNQNDQNREELAARVKDLLTQAALLPEPFRADVIGRARAVAALLRGDDLATGAEEVDALENAYARAAGSARVAEAVQGVKGRVQYRKLQIAWRDAQSAASAELDRFVAAVLADPEVEDDDLYEEVVDAAAAVSTLVPRFGGDLADMLDRLDSTTDAAARETLTREARQVIEDYVASLEEADGLRELQSLSDDEYGGISFFNGLQGALRSLQTAIA